MTDTAGNAIAFLHEFCETHGLELQLEGECGFGRECVGIEIDDAYVDWEGAAAPRPDEAPNAYHKYDCMAVLGRDDAAVMELYQWVMGALARGATIHENAPKEYQDFGWYFMGKLTRTVFS